MAAVTSPVRQPFGCVDEGRLRNLVNVKNKQNALSPASSTSLKRRYQVDSDPSFDAENVDPLLLSPSKKSKNVLGYPSKPSHFVLKQTSSAPVLTTRQVLTPKRLAKKVSDIKPVSFSAPAAPAGRSPKSKRVGILSRRRISGGSYTRVDPPAFSLDGTRDSTGLPFSIDAALSGTVSSYKPEPKAAPVMDTVMTLDNAMPSNWLFEIHEDTPDEELGNLMQHSTQTLDISDDESKARERDARGKENIPPPDYAGPLPLSENISSAPLPASYPVSRKDLMTDEPRTPLGDLDAREFYASGCDANSYIFIDGDKSEKVAAPEPVSAESNVTPTPSPLDAATANQDVWRELLAKVDSRSSPVADEQSSTTDNAGEAAIQAHASLSGEADKAEDAAPIEIWESESAKGDDHQEPADNSTFTTSLEESLAAAENHATVLAEAVH